MQYAFIGSFDIFDEFGHRRRAQCWQWSKNFVSQPPVMVLSFETPSARNYREEHNVVLQANPIFFTRNDVLQIELIIKCHSRGAASSS